MATAYYLIESKTLTSNVASVVFSGISNTYTDLLLVHCGRVESNTYYSGSTQLNFNSGAAGGYQATTNYSDGSSASGFYATDGNSGANTVAGQATSGIFSNTTIYIPQYKNTGINKCWAGIGGGTTSGTTQYNTLSTGSWNSTSAISSITLTTNIGTNWVSGSTFHLYGIINA